MKEFPVVLNASEVVAVRQKRKTQLRQVVKPNKWAKKYWEVSEQLINAGTHYAHFAYKTTTHERAKRENNFVVQREQVKAGTTATLEAMAKDTLLHQDYAPPPIDCPFGQVGDRLWVRESWSTHSCFDDISPKYFSTCSIHYWADGKCQTGKKRPSTQMPRWASRILLEITKIRIERLQDITEADATAEGMVADDDYCAEQYYSIYWNKKHGWKENGWNANPWVWVVEFKVIQGGAL